MGTADEVELGRLEEQVEGGGGDIPQYLSLIRKLKVRRSEKVAQHGMALLNNPSARSKLGAEGKLFLSGDNTRRCKKFKNFFRSCQ